MQSYNFFQNLEIFPLNNEYLKQKTKEIGSYTQSKPEGNRQKRQRPPSWSAFILKKRHSHSSADTLHVEAVKATVDPDVIDSLADVNTVPAALIIKRPSQTVIVKNNVTVDVYIDTL